MKSILIGAFLACLQLFSAVLALPACVEQQVAITGDNKIEVYVDGVRATLPNADNWLKSDTVTVPASARVLAVKGVDKGFAAGILGSGANFVTDGSWRCTDIFSQGWEATSYDDSHWKPAHTHGKNGDFPWVRVAGINNDAYWIWTFRVITGNVVYCRKTLPPCDPCPGAGTGSACITYCEGRSDGDYQSCNGCNVFATCSNGILADGRQCAANDPPLVWDDSVKRCEQESTTCKVCSN